MAITHCEWKDCPGSDEEILSREDGDWHESCLEGYIRGEAEYWYRVLQVRGGPEVDQSIAYEPGDPKNEEEVQRKIDQADAERG